MSGEGILQVGAAPVELRATCRARGGLPRPIPQPLDVSSAPPRRPDPAPGGPVIPLGTSPGLWIGAPAVERALPAAIPLPVRPFGLAEQRLEVARRLRTGHHPVAGARCQAQLR